MGLEAEMNLHKAPNGGEIQKLIVHSKPVSISGNSAFLIELQRPGVERLLERGGGE